MPVAFASQRYWWINIRALRHFFHERLTKHAEWEVRRVACLMFYICHSFYPECLDDLCVQFDEIMTYSNWKVEWREQEMEMEQFIFEE